MSLVLILAIAGATSLVIYFVLFAATIRNAGADAKRYLDEFGDSKRRNLISMLFIAAAFIVPIPVAAIAVMGIGLGMVAKDAIAQHAHMRNTGFNPRFERRLARVSFISPFAIICLFAAKLLAQSNAT